MKKRYISLIILASLLSVGCSDNNALSNDKTSSEQELDMSIKSADSLENAYFDITTRFKEGGHLDKNYIDTLLNNFLDNEETSEDKVRNYSLKGSNDEKLLIKFNSDGTLLESVYRNKIDSTHIAFNFKPSSSNEIYSVDTATNDLNLNKEISNLITLETTEFSSIFSEIEDSIYINKPLSKNDIINLISVEPDIKPLIGEEYSPEIINYNFEKDNEIIIINFLAKNEQILNITYKKTAGETIVSSKNISLKTDENEPNSAFNDCVINDSMTQLSIINLLK